MLAADLGYEFYIRQDNKALPRRESGDAVVVQSAQECSTLVKI